MGTLEVLETVPAQILRAQAQGLLVGLSDGSGTLVTGVLHCTEDELASTKELAGALLPAPLAVVGCYGAAGSSVLQRTDAGGIAAGYPAPAEGQANSSSSDAGSVQFSIKTGGKLAPLEAQLLPLAEACTAGGLLRRLVDNYTPVRCTAELVLSASGAVGGSGLAAAFEELEEQLCGPASFYIVSSLGGSSSDGSSSGGGGTALAAGQHALPGLGPFTVLGASWERVPVLRPYERTAPSSGSNGGSSNGCSAPQLSWAPGAATLRHASLCLDVLAYVPRDMPAAEAVGAVVRPAVRRQLRSMRADAEEAAAAGAALMIPNQPPLRALHFLPPGWPHHLTQIYPLPLPAIESDEEALLPRRKALHRMLGLPLNRPLLRVANACDFDGAGAGSGAALAAALATGGTGGRHRLGDVHVGLPPPPVKGSVHVVQGSYDYYHYMQDKFDDCGWGCAYRSLQTLCSWYARQHYTSRAPPSHREIQAALVQIGDKEPSFIGSKQWIGAIELGFVLDTLLGVTHKVLTVQSGDDMPSLAREIAHHFDTQGTPIMIGGGVLAYTLLGIAFDESSGAAAFLILDPHYTGAEELKKVQGSWVAWKQPEDKAAAGGDLFVSGSFYNLLCPQRPMTV
ncbi:hypothetical protein COHA_009430 [Chlorella ohadii]|uniref:Ufm1-specific protease n=1 Tax=Chlorella ohadii TaxID=2649997 RepID=A0AAD5DES5_9CHLO|nr:hypothetical protein COHA_009430 [Chlorella ohadii]